MSYLFGPVPSRRLGMSLGIDLVPPKTCPLNCLYCEAGRTTVLTRERAVYLPTADILRELDNFLSTEPQLDYITFSGAGEPTLHSDLGRILDHIHTQWPDYRTALLTNGVCMIDSGMRREALGFDVVLPSLDAGTEEVFRRINRPAPGVTLKGLVEALVAFRNEYPGKIWLEVFLLTDINDSPGEIDEIVHHTRAIRPDEVHLNTLDRPAAECGLIPVPFHRLERIAERFAPLLAKPVSRKPMAPYAIPAAEDIDKLITETVLRRPCTLDDLILMTGLTGKVLRASLTRLTTEGRVHVESGVRGEFYRVG